MPLMPIDYLILAVLDPGKSRIQRYRGIASTVSHVKRAEWIVAGNLTSTYA